MEEEKQNNIDPNHPALKMPRSSNTTVIASAIILAGAMIAGAILLRGGGAPKDLSTASPKFNQCLDSGKYADAVTASKTEGATAGVNGTPKGFILVDGKVVDTIDGALPLDMVKSKLDSAIAGKSKAISGINLAPVSDSDFKLGDSNAKVELVLYEDFQCPFCGAFVKQVENSLRDTYVKNGQVEIVYRDFAFLGLESLKAAEAARCAAEQGKFWEYHDYLFAHQMGENQGAFSDDRLKTFAGTLKLK